MNWIKWREMCSGSLLNGAIALILSMLITHFFERPQINPEDIISVLFASSIFCMGSIIILIDDNE